MFAGLPGEKGDRGLPGKYHNTTIVLSCVHSNFSFYKLFNSVNAIFLFLILFFMYPLTNMINDTKCISHCFFFHIFLHI